MAKKVLTLDYRIAIMLSPLKIKQNYVFMYLFIIKQLWVKRKNQYHGGQISVVLLYKTIIESVYVG